MSKFIDNVNYWIFLLFYVLGIILGSLYFFLAPVENGILSTINKDTIISYYDAFYFSVVTISSLGYGDFRPIGFGRAVAMIEVTYGLIIIALMVSKLASERTSTLIKLLYTSDIEKRIRKNIDRINESNKNLKTAMVAHNYDEITSIIDGFKIEYSSYLHFFTYQKKHGDLKGRWAEKLYLKLLRSIKISVERTAEVSKLNNLSDKERKNCEKALSRIDNLTESISEQYKETNITGIASHIKQNIHDNKKYLERLRKGETHPVTLSEKSPALIEKVKQELPSVKPWEYHIHKKIATKLRISNRLAHEIISEIVEEESA